MSKYAHVLLGIPNALHAGFLLFRDDETLKGDMVRMVLGTLHNEKICQFPLSGLVHHVYSITVDDDLDAGNLSRILNKWPTVRRLAAFGHDGLQVGQSYDADGNVVGTPKVKLTAAQMTALRNAWPVEFVIDGRLTPPNAVQGQTRWAI